MSVKDQVQHQVMNQVWDQVLAQVKYRIWHERIELQLSDRVWEQTLTTDTKSSIIELLRMIEQEGMKHVW